VGGWGGKGEGFICNQKPWEEEERGEAFFGGWASKADVICVPLRPHRTSRELRLVCVFSRIQWVGSLVYCALPVRVWLAQGGPCSGIARGPCSRAAAPAAQAPAAPFGVARLQGAPAAGGRLSLWP